MQSLLLDLVTIFALSVAAAVVCHRLRLPSAIGLLLAGVVAGPHALQLVRNAHEIELLAEIGVVLLMFVIGLEISIADLERLKRFFAIGGSIQFFGTAAVVTLLLPLTGLVPQQSLYLGFVVALSSTAIVLRTLQERGELETPHGRSILSILIYQDIGVVPVMLTAPLLAGMAGLGGRGGGLAELGALLLKVILVATFGYGAYRWIVPWVLECITRTRSSEAFLLGVFMLCVGIAVLTQSLGLSLALGAFLAGFILSESEYSHQAVAVMLPFRDVLMSLFFISIGMLLDLKVLAGNLGPMLVLTAAVLLIKPLIAACASLAVGLPLRQAVLSGMALAQVGEFSLVATKAGVSAGLLSQEVFQSVLVVAVLTMLATPLLIQSAPKLAELLATTPLGHWNDRRTRRQQPIELWPQEPPSVLIVGFGVTGRNLAASCRHCDVPYAVVELNAALVRQARSEDIPIHYGDASQSAILELVRAHQARAIVVVIDDAGAARRIVELARRIAPDAFILVRTRYLREVEPLSQLGADEVIADELEVSIEVFSRVLARMLVPRERINELIGDVRGEWRRMARSLAPEATRVHDLRVVLPDLATHSIPLHQGSPWVGQTIASSRLRDDHGVTVLAVQRSRETIANPRGDVVLQVGDVLFVIGPKTWDPALS